MEKDLHILEGDIAGPHGIDHAPLVVGIRGRHLGETKIAVRVHRHEIREGSAYVNGHSMSRAHQRFPGFMG